MTRQFLLASAVGGHQRKPARGLDLLQLRVIPMAAEQRTPVHTQGILGVVGAEVGRPVVEILTHDEYDLTLFTGLTDTEERNGGPGVGRGENGVLLYAVDVGG